MILIVILYYFYFLTFFSFSSFIGLFFPFFLGNDINKCCGKFRETSKIRLDDTKKKQKKVKKKNTK